MSIKKFVKKNYEIFLVNLIVMGLIFITLLAQFGVYIKVDEGVELIPVELGYSQSAVRINSKYVNTTERYVRLKYEKNAKKSFWMPVSAVFGRTDVDDIEGMIKDGGHIKRNVFFNTKSHKVIGITNSGKSILSFYYHNSKFFRYGIWILILCDIFVGLLWKREVKK